MGQAKGSFRIADGRSPPCLADGKELHKSGVSKGEAGIDDCAGEKHGFGPHVGIQEAQPSGVGGGIAPIEQA